MTFDEALVSFRSRYMEAMGQDPADAEEHAAMLLADYEGDVEIRTVTRDHLVRLFLRVRPDGPWLSRYAWDRATVQDLVRRFKEAN